MSYVIMPEKRQNNPNGEKKWAKKKFFSWKFPGKHKIQLLDKEIKPAYVHWVNGAYVACLGSECPVCKENYRIIREAEEAGTDYNKHPDYRRKTLRYYTNVLDLTEVKKCPKCGYESHKRENGTWLDVCEECGQTLINVEPEPSMEVKIMSKGKQLFEKFNLFEELHGDPTSYPIILIVKNSREVDAVPLTNEPIVEGDFSDKMYNLPEEALLKLTPDEMVQLMSGVRVRDILVARRANKENNTTPTVNDDIKSAVDQLLSD